MKKSVMYNIDGSDSSNWGYGGYGNQDDFRDRWIFMLRDEDGSEGEDEEEDSCSEVSVGEAQKFEDFPTTIAEEPKCLTFADLQRAHASARTSAEVAVAPVAEPQAPKSLDLSLPPAWAGTGNWSTPSTASAAASTSPTTESPATAQSYYIGTTAHFGNEKIWEPCSDMLGEEVENTGEDYEIEVPSVHDLDAAPQEGELLSNACTDLLSHELAGANLLACEDCCNTEFGLFLALLNRKREFMFGEVAPIQVEEALTLEVEEGSDEEGPDHGLLDSDSEDEDAASESLDSKHKAQRDYREAIQNAKLGYAVQIGGKRGKGRKGQW